MNKFLNKLKYKLIDVPINTIKSTYLWLRFPFLRAHNAFTGLWNNWHFAGRYHKKYYKDSHVSVMLNFVEDNSIHENICDYDIDINKDKSLWGSLSDCVNGKIYLYVNYGAEIMHVYNVHEYFSEIPKWTQVSTKYDGSIVTIIIKYNGGKALNYLDYPKGLSRFCTVVTDRWKHAIISVLDWIEKYPYQLFHILPTYTWYDAIPTGWRKAFGLQLCKEIKIALKQTGGRKAIREFRITDVKEKWGSLSIYTGGAPDEVHKILAKYEYISLRTCIRCGKTAYGLTEGWVSPLCEDCFKKSSYAVIRPFYTEGNTWYGYTSSNAKERVFHPNYDKPVIG